MLGSLKGGIVPFGGKERGLGQNDIRLNPIEIDIMITICLYSLTEDELCSVGEWVGLVPGRKPKRMSPEKASVRARDK